MQIQIQPVEKPIVSQQTRDLSEQSRVEPQKLFKPINNSPPSKSIGRPKSAYVGSQKTTPVVSQKQPQYDERLRTDLPYRKYNEISQTSYTNNTVSQKDECDRFLDNLFLLNPREIKLLPEEIDEDNFMSIPNYIKSNYTPMQIQKRKALSDGYRNWYEGSGDVTYSVVDTTVYIRKEDENITSPYGKIRLKEIENGIINCSNSNYNLTKRKYSKKYNDDIKLQKHIGYNRTIRSTKKQELISKLNNFFDIDGINYQQEQQMKARAVRMEQYWDGE